MAAPFRTNPNYDWLDDLPLPVGDPFLRMGTRGIDEADWLTVDHKTTEELKLRKDLLLQHPEFAQLVDGHDDQLAELIEHVEAFRGPLAPGPTDSPVRSELANLAVSIQEDVLFMVRNEEHWYLAGGVLLFPDQWALPDKIGLSIADVHGPTNGYDELLAAKVDHFFDRLTVGRVVGRRNWFVHDAPTHFLPSHIDHLPVMNPADVAGLWVRSERQTLRRLERTGAIIFTVKTQFAPFAQVKARPEVASELAAFLEVASERSLRNKDAAGRQEAVITYLTQ